MRNNIIRASTVLAVLSLLPFNLYAKTKQDELSAANLNQADTTSQEVYQLSYVEREPGTDEYEVTMLVSDRYIRVDEPGEKSGYIIYDDKDRVIYSVSHFDRSVLVIREHPFSEGSSPVKTAVEYLQLDDAPNVSGKAIFNYRIFIDDKNKNTIAGVSEEETCTEIQLVEGLLPEVSKILQNYQKVVSGQQVKMTDNKITEIQTDCYYADQIYNTGAYYEKGLPVQEWHSNERSRLLTGYDKIPVDSEKFKVPADYKQFSVDKNSKIPMP
ncbi:MAG: hypothetical protein RQ982_07850 [Gammaproteobacteria bacterium]|nr:hypothetical protein [Gammaproteobacteria bacterium]